MERRRSPRASSRGLVILILVTMTIAPALTTMATNNQNRQTSDLSTTMREGSPTTPTYWARTYGGVYHDEARSVQQTSDGGYIVAGYTCSFDAGAGYSDVWVLKLNSTGGVAWQKTYGGPYQDCACSVQQTADGGYIAAGHSLASDPGFVDVWVLKLNSTGGVTWQKTYGGSDDDYAQSVQQTSDGGYIVAGHTRSFGAGYDDVWVLKLNSAGGVTWQKTYGGSDDDYAQSVQQTSDGGYIVAGRTISFGSGSYDVWVLKLNSTGSVVWQKTYGGYTWADANSIQQTSDGGYIVAGVMSFGSGLYDVWVLKLNSTGSVVWQKAYPGGGSSVQQTSDGDYIVAGYTDCFGAGGGDVWVLKLNSTGGVTWQKTYGGTSEDIANSVRQTSDGGYIVAGYTLSFGAGAGDFWVLKLDSTGSVVWDAGSGASTQITSAPLSDSSATASTTSVAPASSAATVQNTMVTPQNTSAAVTVQAPDHTPPGSVTDLATESPTNSSITLTWTAPGDDGMKGDATGYVVKYSTSGSITDANWTSATTYTQSWTPAKNGSAEAHTVTGLNSTTTYWFAIKAYDECSNHGDISNSPSATTAAEGIPMTIIVGAVVAVAVAVVISIVIVRKRTK